jgi:hypothetical protein
MVTSHPDIWRVAQPFASFAKAGGWPTFAVCAKVGLEGIMPRHASSQARTKVQARVSVPLLTKYVKDGAPQGF